jgi:hypothetical protein
MPNRTGYPLANGRAARPRKRNAQSAEVGRLSREASTGSALGAELVAGCLANRDLPSANGASHAHAPSGSDGSLGSPVSTCRSPGTELSAVGGRTAYGDYRNSEPKSQNEKTRYSVPEIRACASSAANICAYA